MSVLGSYSGVDGALMGALIWAIVYASIMRYLRKRMIEIPSSFLVAIGVGGIVFIATLTGILDLKSAMALAGMLIVSGLVMGAEQIIYIGEGNAKKIKRLRGE